MKKVAVHVCVGVQYIEPLSQLKTSKLKRIAINPLIKS